MFRATRNLLPHKFSIIIIIASMGPASVQAANRKTTKYGGLPSTHILQPVAIETLGPINPSACNFHQRDRTAHLDHQWRWARNIISLSAPVNNNPAIQSCGLLRYLLLCGRRRGLTNQTTNTPNKLIIFKSLGERSTSGHKKITIIIIIMIMIMIMIVIIIII